ncbi:MAG TPA: sulfatase-like hydrolase/transferase, partial [Elusimicrobiota bacterium]|nr:sulfatase-like hydrolase/transferase [Elusimicrobiota bacterium]
MGKPRNVRLLRAPRESHWASQNQVHRQLESAYRAAFPGASRLGRAPARGDLVVALDHHLELAPLLAPLEAVLAAGASLAVHLFADFLTRPAQIEAARALSGRRGVSFLVASRWMRAEARGRLPGASVAVVSPPVSPAFFATPMRRPARERPRLAYAGRIHPDKGLDQLLERLLRSEAAPSSFEILGARSDDRYETWSPSAADFSFRQKRLECLIELLGLAPRLMKTEKALAAAYARLDACVFPSVFKAEEYGYALAQALAAGKTCWVSDWRGHRDFADCPGVRTMPVAETGGVPRVSFPESFSAPAPPRAVRAWSYRHHSVAAAAARLKAVLAAAALVLALAAAPARAGSGPAELPPAASGYNLILISLGNVGTAHMSLYGYPRETTPALEAWARDAVVFENAYSPASWTLPVGTSLFTSLYPFAHGVTARGARNILNPDVPTLPEILRRAGYATAAFTGGLDYYKGFGHMRGFETVADNPDFTGYATTLPQASAWLAKNERRPFFLFIHGYDAHCPFIPPPPPILGAFTRDNPDPGFDASRCLRGSGGSSDGYVVEPGPRCDLDKTSLECAVSPSPAGSTKIVLKQADVDHLRDLYDEDVLSVDAQIGRFLASLSAATLSRTVVVVYCEHGEMFAKHGLFGRPGAVRGVLFDDVLHVPLLVRLPRPEPRRVRAMVSLVDVMPTLLDLLGLPAAPDLRIQGRDLRPLIEGGSAPAHDRIFAGSSSELGHHSAYKHPLASASVRDKEWKLMSEEVIPRAFFSLSKEELAKRGEPPPELYESLYHVAADPDEKNDMIDRRPDVARRLREDLRRWREACRELQTGRPPGTKPVPASLLHSAKERGYW